MAHIAGNCGVHSNVYATTNMHILGNIAKQVSIFASPEPVLFINKNSVATQISIRYKLSLSLIDVN